MASHNEITGDALVSKLNNNAYRDNYDRIFGKKKENDNAVGNQSVAVNGSVVSVSSVSGTGSAGACGGVRDDNPEGSTAQG